jgi:hypothetical protein
LHSGYNRHKKINKITKEIKTTLTLTLTIIKIYNKIIIFSFPRLIKI